MDQMDQTLILIIAAAGLFIYFFFHRWIHRIDGHINRLDATVQLLAEIAKKQGVDSDKIDEILIGNYILYRQRQPLQQKSVPNPDAANDPYALPTKPGLIVDNR